MNKSSSGPLFTPAKTQRASEAIYNQIYPKIVSGELKPGDRLPSERELAEMFQRSRPVVREALRMLQQDGLLETSVGSAGGAVIRGISLKSVEEPLKNLVAMGAINLEELLEYRHINDRGCARLAAIHHTEEDAAALQKTLAGSLEHVDSLLSFQEYDVAFHNALAKASHNTLASMINDVIVRLNTDVFMETVQTYPPERLREINMRIYQTHYTIMEAVLAHDPDGADQAVTAMGSSCSRTSCTEQNPTEQDEEGCLSGSPPRSCIREADLSREPRCQPGAFRVCSWMKRISSHPSRGR